MKVSYEILTNALNCFTIALPNYQYHCLKELFPVNDVNEILKSKIISEKVRAIVMTLLSTLMWLTFLKIFSETHLFKFGILDQKLFFEK
jgi:hypothetical protein